MYRCGFFPFFSQELVHERDILALEESGSFSFGKLITVLVEMEDVKLIVVRIKFWLPIPAYFDIVPLKILRKCLLVLLERFWTHILIVHVLGQMEDNIHFPDIENKRVEICILLVLNQIFRAQWQIFFLN